MGVKAARVTVSGFETPLWLASRRLKDWRGVYSWVDSVSAKADVNFVERIRARKNGTTTLQMGNNGRLEVFGLFHFISASAFFNR